MRSGALVLGLVMFAASSAGCGTLTNLPPPDAIVWMGAPRPSPRTYGGIRSELALLMELKSEAEDVSARKALPLPLLLVDLPLTLIGDTITLPYTLSYDCGFFGRIAMNAPPDRDPLP